MSERFRERLGYLSEELEGHLRSTSPAGSRSPRRASRSPRPNASDAPNIAVAIPLIRDSRPEIAAWPAPPQAPQLSCVSGNVRTLTSAPPPLSPAALSPISNSGLKHNEIDDSTTLLTMLKVAAATSTEPGQQIGRETELKKKIQTLEETVAEYERQKFNVMGTFSEYRERVAERERKLEAEYSSKIIALSEEVLGAKKDFENRMKSFQALQDKFEREKEQALEKLRQEHQKEIQLLEQRFSESQLLNLEQKYMIEIQRLEEERKSLRAEKERLGETFEMKLRRAQSLYETELTAAKMLYTKELEALRDHEEALKEELLARQEEFHDRLQELQHHSKRNRDELSNCKNEVTALEKKLQTKESEVQSISKQLEEARTETSESLRKLSKATTENNEYKEQFQQQEEELKKKARLLVVVEAAKSKLEAMIRDLQDEVKALKNKVEFLEKERDNLQSQSESQAQLQHSQVDALEAVLETVTKEKEATKEHYEGLLTKEKQQAEAREHAMKKEFSAKLNELEEQYTSLKEDLEHSARLDQDELRESTQQEISSLRSEKSLLEAEVLALKQKFLTEEVEEDDITKQLEEIVSKTTELTSQLDSYRERIKSKDEEVAGLRKRLEEEQTLSDQQLDALRAELRQEMLTSDEYTGTLHENEQLHSKIAEYEREKEKAEEEESKELVELRKENDILHKEIEDLKKSVVSKTDSLVEELQTQLKLKQEEIYTLKNSGEEDLVAEMKQLRLENSSKTTQLEQLLERVNELTEQMGNIKGELEQKTVELKQIKEKNDDFARNITNPLMVKDNKTFPEQKEQDELIFSMKQREVQLKTEIEELKLRLSEVEDDSGNDKAIEEKDAEIAEKDKQISNLMAEKEQMIQESEDIAKAREALLAKESSLQEKEKKLIQLKEEMKADLDKREETLNEKQAHIDDQLRLQNEKSEIETNCMDCQTDPLPTPTPIAIVDLAREKELKTQIEELESAIERKNQLIQKLQERVPDEHDEMPKKKDRSQSVSSGGVFQSFVSQMKDKREEAAERSKKKEAEKKAEKAAKEAAKEIAKEKSPIRSKSPSLLTRLRDRSPAKAKSPNLETTPSNSNRNLLSPTEAERPLERKGSPSRALFGKKKDMKETVYSPSDKRPAWKF